jgi:hypothetical protein
MSNLITILCCAGIILYPLIIGAWIAYQVLYLGQAIDAELTLVLANKM